MLRRRQLCDDVVREALGDTAAAEAPGVLEEYQARVEELRRELGERQCQLKQLQAEHEQMVHASQQDLRTLEAKEQEIERLKRAAAKLQKESVQLRSDMRKGPARPAPAKKPSALQSKKQGEEGWMSRELDQNIKHFNELFIENLSQSLSSVLALRKEARDEEPAEQEEEPDASEAEDEDADREEQVDEEAQQQEQAVA